MNKALLVIAQNGFQDVELKGVRDGLMNAGFAVELASTNTGPCTGKFGSVENATVSIQSADVLQYDRVGFIGGPGAAALADDPNAHALARATTDAGKPLGAICIAPTILAKAGLLKGKKATVWNKDGKPAELLKASGAEYLDQQVVVDGLIVTGDGPDASVEFGNVFAALSQ